MTPTELASLEALAKAATPGPWKHVETIAFHTGLTYTSVQPVDPDPDKMRPMLMASGEYHLCRMSHTAAQHAIAIHRANAAFIAAANPAAILSLIEENKRMREALTPSAETKAAYIGEFRFSVLEYVDDDGTEYESEFTVPWTTIKEIMAAIRARAALEPQS